MQVLSPSWIRCHLHLSSVSSQASSRSLCRQSKIHFALCLLQADAPFHGRVVSDISERLFVVGASNLTVDFFRRIPFLIYSSLVKNQISKLLTSVPESHATVVKAAISNYRKAIDEGLLLKLPFTTIFEYLQLLQMVAEAMNCLGRQGMFYLAAAVSDFYVPWESMAKHKIESASGPLNMQLNQVPKMLFILRKQWAPSAFCVSFKLETDPDILLEKAEAALRKYGMNVVVANELANYKDVVVMVTSNGRTTVRRPSKEDDVEEQLIDLLVKMHSEHIVQLNQDHQTCAT
uniref:DNA/pantothenate metabolism flavoprotein C-terminal domain-containing protein n=1 Tax=Oryza brachyantha TaxID=4533 RepID=J3MQU0_ORYBR